MLSYTLLSGWTNAVIHTIIWVHQCFHTHYYLDGHHTHYYLDGHHTHYCLGRSLLSYTLLPGSTSVVIHTIVWVDQCCYNVIVWIDQCCHTHYCLGGPMHGLPHKACLCCRSNPGLLWCVGIVSCTHCLWSMAPSVESHVHLCHLTRAWWWWIAQQWVVTLHFTDSILKCKLRLQWRYWDDC